MFLLNLVVLNGMNFPESRIQNLSVFFLSLAYLFKSQIFSGIRFYQGRGHDIPALSCNGGHFDDVNGYQISAPSGQCYDIGSLFVHAGCKLYGFCDYNYEGLFFHKLYSLITEITCI